MSESSMTFQLPPPAHLASSHRDERRPQASPLPLKRGEIGFEEGAHGVTNNESAEATSSLPPRHPADRDYQPPTRLSSLRPSQTVNETRSAGQSSSESFTVTKGLFGLLKPKKVPSIGGLQSTTLLLFTVQLIVLGGTIALWIFAARRVQANTAFTQQQNSMGTVTTFIHVVFVVIIILQLVLLERRIYRLRGERYNYLNPGQVLPRHRQSLSSSSVISSAPWNRPPLPTYAVVLAQSGAGTGDVEDNFIAIPPPPAYGNVRGSTLLLYSPRDTTFSAAVTSNADPLRGVGFD